MRRLRVALPSIVVVALIGALGASSAASRQRVVCPSPEPAYPPPCCTCCMPTEHAATMGPGPVCCPVPTNDQCPSSPTISSAPDPSKEGHAVTISGRLFGSSASGATVVLWQKLAGQATFQQIDHTAADALGAYTFTEKAGTVRTNREWYVTANGTQSPTLTQAVQSRVGLDTARTSIAMNKVLVLTGRVAPSHAGERVRVERQTAHGWKIIARPVLSKLSTFLVRLRFGRAGTVHLRVVFAGDSRNVRSYSRTLAVHVT